MILLNLLFFILIPLVSGSFDSFDEKFVTPSMGEKKTFQNLLDEFLKLDFEKKDVSEILKTFDKPKIVTIPCKPNDINNLVVNVVETRLAGFTVPEEHEGEVLVGGTYSWQCKITTSSKGIITMDCDNTIKLNPDVIFPSNEKDKRSQKVDNLVILYHELLHGQLMLDAISSSEKWRNDVCNKKPNDKIDYSYSDKQHIVINPLQEEFTSKLMNREGGVFFLEKINPEETENAEFIRKITSRFEHPQLVDSGITITYRGINTNALSVSFQQEDIVISGKLIDKTKSGTVWLYAFPDDTPKTKTEQKIPQWIKNNASWWSEGSITDTDFVKGIEYLIQNNIMKIQNVEKNSVPSKEIPSWIRNNAGWWSSELISDAEFISGIKYLIEAGIIAYQ